jgi:hypothetical protein
MDANFDQELVKLMNDPFYREQYHQQQRDAIIKGTDIVLKDPAGKTVKTLKIVPSYASR